MSDHLPVSIYFELRGRLFCIDDLLVPETMAAVRLQVDDVAAHIDACMEEQAQIWREEQEIRERQAWLERRIEKLLKIGRGVVSCVTCGKTDPEDLCIDHIHPKARGGSNRPDNLQILCRRCNGEKGTKTMAEWLGVWV